MAKHKPNKIWIDADACPRAVKEIVFKAAKRLQISVVLVANSYQTVPMSDLIQLVVVGSGFDEADQYIVDRVEMHDLVITADIPLAALVLKKRAVALNPRGEIYTQNNIGPISSMRDFMKGLRDAGAVTSGPPPLDPKDVKRFADSLNRLL
jgi:uncharacterized protein